MSEARTTRSGQLLGVRRTVVEPDPPMKIGHAFLKRNRFNKLHEYVQIFSKGGDKHKVWLESIALTEKLMSVSYDILMVKCFYQRSSKTYWELYSEEEVFKSVFVLLDSASRAVYAHKDEDTEPDLSTFDRDLNNLLKAIHEATGSISKRRVPGPDGVDDRENAYWDKFPGMLDPNVSKIVIWQQDAWGAPTLLSPQIEIIEDYPSPVKKSKEVESP